MIELHKLPPLVRATGYELTKLGSYFGVERLPSKPWYYLFWRNESDASYRARLRDFFTYP